MQPLRFEFAGTVPGRGSRGCEKTELQASQPCRGNHYDSYNDRAWIPPCTRQAPTRPPPTPKGRGGAGCPALRAAPKKNIKCIQNWWRHRERDAAKRRMCPPFEEFTMPAHKLVHNCKRHRESMMLRNDVHAPPLRNLQCPLSARSVPAQCPLSAGYVFPQCPLLFAF